MVGDKEPKALPFFLPDAKPNDVSRRQGANNIKKLIFFIFLSRIDSLSTDILSVFTGGLQIPKGKVIAGICRYVKGNKVEVSQKEMFKYLVLGISLSFCVDLYSMPSTSRFEESAKDGKAGEIICKKEKVEKIS